MSDGRDRCDEDAPVGLVPGGGVQQQAENLHGTDRVNELADALAKLAFLTNADSVGSGRVERTNADDEPLRCSVETGLVERLSQLG
jgi:hypothetical protein